MNSFSFNYFFILLLFVLSCTKEEQVIPIVKLPERVRLQLLGWNSRSDIDLRYFIVLDKERQILEPINLNDKDPFNYRIVYPDVLDFYYFQRFSRVDSISVINSKQAIFRNEFTGSFDTVEFDFTIFNNEQYMITSGAAYGAREFRITWSDTREFWPYKVYTPIMCAMASKKIDAPDVSLSRKGPLSFNTVLSDGLENEVNIMFRAFDLEVGDTVMYNVTNLWFLGKEY